MPADNDTNETTKPITKVTNALAEQIDTASAEAEDDGLPTVGHDSVRDSSADRLPTVGNAAVLPPPPAGYQVLLDEEAKFKTEEASTEDVPEDRLRRWGRDMRRGSAFCLVRLRAYGEARAHQGDVNEGLRKGQRMRILLWDRGNGWKKSHANNAVKIYQAWVGHGSSYPISWGGMTVREVLATLTEKKTASKVTTTTILSSWLKKNFEAGSLPEKELLATKPKVVEFTRRAIASFSELGDDAVEDLIEELRGLLPVESPNDDPTLASSKAPLEPSEAKEVHDPKGEPKAASSAPQSDQNDVVEADDEGTMADAEGGPQDTPIKDHRAAKDVPEGLVYLSSKKSPSEIQEPLRRDPGLFSVREDAKPVATLRKTTPLYQEADVRRVPKNNMLDHLADPSEPSS